MVTAFVLINCVPGKENEVYKKLSEIKSISETYTLFGEYDLISKIETKDYKELESTIIQKIRTIAGIVETKTLTGIKF
ncbi:MAG: Lrp/AsnC ligand binding domain-containing protein [Candidatus Thermoplasmatota archaeon]|nr:Lrp/AsnC ligand binding domain-containing protein [Candidatus Thermoplasmatota archaeon]